MKKIILIISLVIVSIIAINGSINLLSAIKYKIVADLDGEKIEIRPLLNSIY